MNNQPPERKIVNHSSPNTCPKINVQNNEVQNLQSAFRGCMLGHAIGDAMGMPVEGLYPTRIQKYYGFVESYLKGPMLPKGSYTDDTHHSLILAKSLIEMNEFDPKDFLSKLLHAKQKRTIGGTTLQALSRFFHGFHWSNTGIHSPSNGSAMRVMPLALMYANHPDFKEKVIESSIVTHNHPDAIAGCFTVAFTLQYLLINRNKPFKEKEFLLELVSHLESISKPFAEIIKTRKKILIATLHAADSIPKALFNFLDIPNHYKNLILMCVNEGGDADTVSAIAGSFSGVKNGIKAIPKEWIEGLEDEEEGRTFILEIADTLYQISSDFSKTA